MPSSAVRMQIHRSDQRGRTDIGWLHSRHSFSFGRYYDPAHRGFRSLRVLNDDIVEPSAGFGEHGHDNMEILTWVLQGGLRHTDSTGTNGVIRPGELQAMSAGRGIRHSELNESATEPVHFLQIWIEPRAEARDIEPSFAQKIFEKSTRAGRWQTLASADGRDGSLRIQQNATFSVAELSPAQSIEVAIDDRRYGYLHLAYGALNHGGSDMLNGGDAIRMTGPARLMLQAREASQVLLFDLE